MVKMLSAIMSVDETLVERSGDIVIKGMVYDPARVQTGEEFMHRGLVYTVTVCHILHRAAKPKGNDGPALARSASYVLLVLRPIIGGQDDPGERRALIANVLQTFAKRLEMAGIPLVQETNLLAEEIDNKLASRGYYNGREKT